MKLSNEAKVGILVTAALAALIWGLNYLKGKDLFKGRNRYYAVYESVDGLVKSNPVFMNGFRIGIVNNISFMPDHSGKLLVTLLIEDGVFISDNSVAKIFSSDLIGTKALRIDLGDSPTPIADEDTLKAELEISFAQQFSKEVSPIKSKSEHLIESLDSAAVMMRTLFDPHTKNNLQQSIQHLNGSLASIDQLVSDDQSKLRVMLNNLASITGNLNRNNDKIQSVINNFANISDSLSKMNFAAVLQQTQSVLTQSDAILKKIDRGEGSLGLLVNDSSLYVQLDSSAKALNVLMNDLHAHPGRYVHFSVFGKKDK